MNEREWRERLKKLTPAARRALAMRLRHPTLASWIAARRPAHSPSPAHLAKLVEALTRAVTVGGSRIVVCMPPRHGKSETLMSCVAWAIERSPGKLNAYTTYSQLKATAKSRKIRQLVEEGDVQLNWESFAAHDWRTNLGGGLIASGVAGGLTGEGVTGLLIVDDPLKNRKDAESLKKRDDVWDWFTDVVNTRLQPGASCVVVLTRWHDDDIVGRIKRTIQSRGADNDGAGEWELIEMPAVRSGPTLQGDDLQPSDSGFALWPERYPIPWLRRARAFSEYAFASLYQQQPRPRGGRVFRDPARYTSRPTTPTHVVLALDAAGTKGTRANRSALVALAIDYVERAGYDKPLARAHVLEVESLQETPDEVAKCALAFQRRHGNAPMYIELTRDGKSVRTALSRMADGAQIQFRYVVPIGDKFTRAQPVASAWNNGLVLVPNAAPWLEDFLEVVGKFTGMDDPRDDEVDALAHAFNAAMRLPVSIATARPGALVDANVERDARASAFPRNELARGGGRSRAYG